MKRVLATIMAAVVLSLGTVSVATAQDTGTEASSDNTGLWGLAGLLGLAGLAGLKRRDDHDRR